MIKKALEKSLALCGSQVVARITGEEIQVDYVEVRSPMAMPLLAGCALPAGRVLCAAAPESAVRGFGGACGLRHRGAGEP